MGKETEGSRLAEAVAEWDPHREVAEAIAQAGFTKEECNRRLACFYPDLPAAELSAVINEWGLVFRDASYGSSTFTDAALKGALLYLVGTHLGLQPDPGWSAVGLASDVITDVGAILLEAGFAAAESSTVLSVIGAAQRTADQSEVTITGKQYDALRAEVLEAAGLTSGKGARLWPPTRQTLIKRFGGWNDALVSLGLGAPSRGRPRGLTKFSDDDYRAAIKDFLVHCQTTNIPHTFTAYGNWSRAENADGNQRPSDAAIRLFFGSWSNASLAVANEFPDSAPAKASGASLYQQEDYVASLREFIAHASASGLPVQYATYKKWTGAQRSEGIHHPSANSVQNFFGSWSAGLRAVSEG